jgi:organic hydroperoxide reductase OsmC/OhrA
MAIAPFPHLYTVEARARGGLHPELTGKDLEPISLGATPEFGGDPGFWSPETLLLGSVAGCFLLTFQAMANLSSQKWEELSCQVQGTVEKVEGRLAFSRILLQATLLVPPGQGGERARRLLARAEEHCLVARSLRTPVELQADVIEKTSR